MNTQRKCYVEIGVDPKTKEVGFSHVPIAAGGLLEALEEIASQVLTSEMHPSMHVEADFEEAYDRMIRIARGAKATHLQKFGSRD